MNLDPMMVLKKFEGFKLDEAESIAKVYGWKIRVTIKDKKFLPHTADFDKMRVNVEVVDGVIAKVLRIG